MTDRRGPLTDAFIRSARHKETRQELRDGIVPGLFLVVYEKPSDKKTWTLRFRGGDRKIRKETLGRYPDLSIAEARRRARDLKEKIQAGAEPVRAKYRAAPELQQIPRTVSELVDRFIERYTRQKKSGDQTERYLRNYVLPAWGPRAITSIKRGEVVALLDAIVDAGKPVAANRCFAAVRRMMNWAVERSYLEISPCYGVKPPTAEGEGRSRVLNASELAAILQAAKETPFPFGPYLTLLLATATRRNELAHVRRSDIDRQVLLIPAERAKNKIARSVPLSSFALSILETLPTFEDGRLFPSGNPAAVDRGISGFGKMTARFRTKCKVENWRLHDLRRSAASHMQALGTDVETIKTILGHKAVGGVTGIYARHAYTAESVAALERWGEFLANLLTPEPAKVIPIREHSRHG